MLTKCILVIGQLILLLSISACSINQMAARMSSLFVEQRIAAINRQSNLPRVKIELQQSIKRLESMLATGVNRKRLHVYASQVYYAYAFAFLEHNDRSQARKYYYQALLNARQALSLYGISDEVWSAKHQQLSKQLKRLPEESVAALYWAAVSWAKLIELEQQNVLLFSQLPKVVLMMERVLQLDASYNQGGAYLFFAVYWSRPIYLGGNEQRARQYFEQARAASRNRLLIVDYLQVRYLFYRKEDKAQINHRLKMIMRAPDSPCSEHTLLNAVVRLKAARWLQSGRA